MLLNNLLDTHIKAPIAHKLCFNYLEILFVKIKNKTQYKSVYLKSYRVFN